LSEKIQIRLKDVKREHSIALYEAQEKEKLKIATEIHDGLVQMLTGILY